MAKPSVLPPAVLPPAVIRERWVRVTEFPARNRFGKRSVVIDRCYTHDGKPHSVHVTYVADHPFLAILDRLPHVPRVVKALYRGSVRLGHLCATEVWPVMRDENIADAAWSKYLAALPLQSSRLARACASSR